MPEDRKVTRSNCVEEPASVADRLSVLFVGSFKSAGVDGTVGGQMYACRSLLDSPLGKKYNWLLLDSTANSNIPEVFLVRLARALWRLARFSAFLLTKKIDCCIIFAGHGWSFVEKGTMVVLGKFAGKRIVLAPRSGLVLDEIDSSRLVRSVILHSVRASDCVVCQGKYWKSFYQSISGEPADKFRVIQNWVRIDNYLPRKSIDSDNVLKILFLSWVDANKGIFDLVTVAERLVNQYGSLLFLIAGSGVAIQEVKCLVASKKLERYFAFLGWVQGGEKYRLLQTSDIFVLPSYREGFPNSVIEAMASCLPVVCTSVGAIPEIVEHNVNGLLFEAGDTGAFEVMLEKLVSNIALRTKLGMNARTTVIQNNSLETAVREFAAVIEGPS